MSNKRVLLEIPTAREAERPHLGGNCGSDGTSCPIPVRELRGTEGRTYTFHILAGPPGERRLIVPTPSGGSGDAHRGSRNSREELKGGPGSHLELEIISARREISPRRNNQRIGATRASSNYRAPRESRRAVPVPATLRGLRIRCGWRKSCQFTVVRSQLPGAAVLLVLFALLLVRMSEIIRRLRRLAQITEGSGDGQSSISFTLCLFSENL